MEKVSGKFFKRNYSSVMVEVKLVIARALERLTVWILSLSAVRQKLMFILSITIGFLSMLPFITWLIKQLQIVFYEAMSYERRLSFLAIHRDCSYFMSIPNCEDILARRRHRLRIEPNISNEFSTLSG